MKFEKWQALGNDYLIVEASALSFPLTAAAVRRLCDRHTGPGGDGVLELAPADAPGFAARLRIFNPDGSEAELSGNGAREAILYLRRAGWTDQDQFSIQTVAGEIRPTILGPTTCRVDMGRAFLRSEHFPSGGPDGAGEVAGRRFQHVWIGNPQCAIRVADRAELDALDLPAIGPGDRARPAVPQPHERLVLVRRPARAPSARGSSSAAWGRRSPRAPARAAPPWPTRCAGATSPVTVELDGGELEVEVDESLHVDLTGWAVPVYRGELSDDLLEELR